MTETSLPLAQISDATYVAPLLPVLGPPLVPVRPLFQKRIRDCLGPVGTGVTAPLQVRAEDGLLYIAKHDHAEDGSTVRAAEYIWLSVARMVHIPVAEPEVLVDRDGSTFLATRKQPNVVGDGSPNANFQGFISGRLYGCREQLARIFAFDLFTGNGDRHPGNYLILKEGETFVIYAIDFSHVAIHPGLPQRFGDPATSVGCATRHFFSIFSAKYGCQASDASDILNRLATLRREHIASILDSMPNDWLDQTSRQSVLEWWSGPSPQARIDQLFQGFGNGTYL